jgi:hypothetical protein
LLETSQALLSSLKDEDSLTATRDQHIRQVFESLEKDLLDGEDMLGDQLREHHKVIILYLKQLVGSRERLLANKKPIHKAPGIVKSNKSISAVSSESRVVSMTQEDLVKKYGLTDNQLQVLEESTEVLLNQHKAFSKELGVVGDNLTELARLQQTFTEQLEWQSALGERLLDEADSTMGTVVKGNKILEKVSSDSTMRNMVVIVFLLLSLLLILFAMLD